MPDDDSQINMLDELAAQVLLYKFDANKKDIGKRIKLVSPVGVIYNTHSVKLYHDATELFSLGYFESTIFVCRAAAEYLAYEIFVERIEIDGERSLIARIAEGLDFRRIVNDFLFRRNHQESIIDKGTADTFNKIYNLGNNRLHPKLNQESSDIESDALESMSLLMELIDSLRRVFHDYEIDKGVLKPKPNYKPPKRAIKLE